MENQHTVHHITKTTVLFTAIGFLAGVLVAGALIGLRMKLFAGVSPFNFLSAQAER
ncbi:MAG: hypothetical protein RL681_166 [Candidatus Parcubacteria bacterium]|jgi:hypothetical protein